MTVIFNILAGGIITAHILVLMWFARACCKVWKQGDILEGFEAIVGRAVLGTGIYGSLAVVLVGPFFILAWTVGALSPGVAASGSMHTELADRVPAAAFLWPLIVTSGNFAVAIVLVLTSFILLGIVTMLPGLGYGSKAVWGAIGLAGYAAYLYLFMTMTVA